MIDQAGLSAQEFIHSFNIFVQKHLSHACYIKDFLIYASFHSLFIASQDIFQESSWQILYLLRRNY